MARWILFLVAALLIATFVVAQDPGDDDEITFVDDNDGYDFTGYSQYRYVNINNDDDEDEKSSGSPVSPGDSSDNDSSRFVGTSQFASPNEAVTTTVSLAALAMVFAQLL